MNLQESYLIRKLHMTTLVLMIITAMMQIVTALILLWAKL